MLIAAELVGKSKCGETKAWTLKVSPPAVRVR